MPCEDIEVQKRQYRIIVDPNDGPSVHVYVREGTNMYQVYQRLALPHETAETLMHEGKIEAQKHVVRRGKLTLKHRTLAPVPRYQESCTDSTSHYRVGVGIASMPNCTCDEKRCPRVEGDGNPCHCP
jgi:hypothetical protein